MPAKTQQLQIRVTPQQKSALKRLARAAGCDLSTYVLARVTPLAPARFAELVRGLDERNDQRYVLAELHDFLHACPPMEFPAAVSDAPLDSLSAYLRNYVAAMVELAADAKGLAPPSWTRDVEPLDAPYFATPLTGLRLHLLRAAPVPFKRRNIFVDASIGARV